MAFQNLIKGIYSCETVQFQDEDWLISGDSSGCIKIWNLKNFDCIKILENHTSKILMLKLLENNNLISVSRNNVVKLWDLKTSSFECLKTFQADHIPGITAGIIHFTE